MTMRSCVFSRYTIVVSIIMVVSASFTRQLMEFTTARIGKTCFKILLGSVVIGMTTAFFAAEIKQLLKPSRIIVMLTLLLVVLFYLWKIDLPQVRMHIVMYAVVGWLATRDLTRADRTRKAIVAAWVFAAVAGASEELFQMILPYRVFEPSDILLNIAGATLGVVIFLIRPPHAIKK